MLLPRHGCIIRYKEKARSSLHSCELIFSVVTHTLQYHYQRRITR
nr:MAG TPA: hypothetical protein [Caudoviricetes sp.]